MSSSTLNIHNRAWRKFRRAILIRDQFTCQYCGQRATQVDHVISRNDGGTDHPSNLRAACAKCNRAKGFVSVVSENIALGSIFNKSGIGCDAVATNYLPLGSPNNRSQVPLTRSEPEQPPFPQILKAYDRSTD